MHQSKIESALPEIAANFILRPIQPADNQQVARIIRTVMTEFGAVGEGYSILDPEVDSMCEAYSGLRSVFFVVAKNDSGEVLGCGGIGPLTGSDEDVCELKKMYFYPALRGLGFGKKMVSLCLEKARALGYRRCYLETCARMEQANQLYQKMGFEKICGPMGATGHCSCDAWYVREV
ncbi:MAG: GNAT family N-acetyltransferase [Saprospiraceae bacterium]|nr:GNAT family N-acetyltransferase [Saprospiraceae bacterium]MCF8251604.1 GNAT family N-acetyltransferase [Saprospiraceae bacterium]MCF8282066.1 GNAT family N-acetyltransferase [Bacteroidales bacterium]MCF8313499.1 GNAT family N-acetyltransferase [Saprospiraceae bacterium]MCF8442240.1 GNAT family N-acetyltransferase [Saprospiraceae bacterium]